MKIEKFSIGIMGNYGGNEPNNKSKQKTAVLVKCYYIFVIETTAGYLSRDRKCIHTECVNILSVQIIQVLYYILFIRGIVVRNWDKYSHTGRIFHVENLWFAVRAAPIPYIIHPY